MSRPVDDPIAAEQAEIEALMTKAWSLQMERKNPRVLRATQTILELKEIGDRDLLWDYCSRLLSEGLPDEN